MTNEIDYFVLAEIQIHKAIDLYLEDNLQGYVCALTLSGAAEGFLGGYLGIEHRVSEKIKKQSAKNQLCSEKQIIDEMNKTYNSLKHHKEIESLKPVDDSLLMLLRAINNYVIALNKITYKMNDFINSDKVKTDLNGIING